MHDAKQAPWTAAATSAGIDHVRLSYLYLDDNDPDAYDSLVHPSARATRPDCWGGRHDIHRLIADGDSIAAVGTYISALGARQLFTDVFTLSGEGLLLGVRRFHAA